MPDVPSPLYSYGLAPETPGHIAINCPLTAGERERLAISLAPRAMRNYRDFIATFEDANKARVIVRWFFKLNRLKKFRLTIEINGTSKKQADKKRSKNGRIKDGSATEIRRA
jgi:hypothetical protein